MSMFFLRQSMCFGQSREAIVKAEIIYEMAVACCFCRKGLSQSMSSGIKVDRPQLSS
jgi:hypothetical protein